MRTQSSDRHLAGHPSRTETEFVVETAGTGGTISELRLLSGGTVDTVQLRATAMQAHTLLYIIGGDIRTVPLIANGSAPKSRVQRALSTSACAFVIDAPDFAVPLSSRFIVSTAGTDGQCGSADDGRAEVRLTGTGGPTFAPIGGDAPLGLLRDPRSLAPSAWIYPRRVAFWNNPENPVQLRAAPARAFAAVLATAPDGALVADGARLSLLGASATETALDGPAAAGSAWSAVGHDRDAFYAVEGGLTTNSAWKVVKVTRSSPQAVQLAAGSGQVVSTAMGRGSLYVTVFGSSDNRLIRIPKSGAAVVTTSEPLTGFTTVLTSAGNVHQRVRSARQGGSQSLSVEFVDENDTALLAVPGGLPMNMADATVHDFNSSESRTYFIVAGNFGGRGFADATLTGFDSVSRTATTLGRLPGRVEFGNDSVFAQLNAPPGTTGAGFAARVTAGGALESASRVFTFQLGAADSLRYVTRTQ